ncbi:MAG: S26 family signal peptidase [Gemmataceae bacterium]
MAKDSIPTNRPAAAPPAGGNGAAAPQPAVSTKVKDKEKEKKAAEPRDLYREVAETVVFVVVLVLMLKTFVAEAFVIPTGSMAETLYGYHKMVECEKCGYRFPVNCSNEVDPPNGMKSPVRGCQCPNCGYEIKWPVERRERGDRVEEVVNGPDWSSGDRVLVAKFLFDNDHLWKPKRHEVIVFKYPGRFTGTHVEDGPQKGDTAMNYIKRCEGESEETVAIFGGDLYVTKSLKHALPAGDRKDWWHDVNMHMNDGDAVDLFLQSLKRRIAGKPVAGDFEIVRKPLKTIMDVRRIVNDNDFQPTDLAGKPQHQRWQFADKGGWNANDPKTPKVFAHKGAGSSEEWLEYKHLLRADTDRHMGHENPEKFETDPRRLITNVMGYNSGLDERNRDGGDWVGDLMLDCTVKVTEPHGELVFDLAKGIDRFQARFDLAVGDCTLSRLTGKTDEKQEKTELSRKPTKLKSTGEYHIRFANFDERLTVWVDGQLPFGDGVDYPAPTTRGPIGENDLRPARIGAIGAGVEISHLQLWRDGYYTIPGDGQRQPAQTENHEPILTMYVQPGHYLALGDNSSSSSDSRYWGLVPERLLLGRALVVYFPFWPFSNPSRVGFIR